MKAIRIIKATVESQELGFYTGNDYEFDKFQGIRCAVNERGKAISFIDVVESGATIKMVKL
jgi:hypothetical protein